MNRVHPYNKCSAFKYAANDNYLEKKYAIIIKLAFNSKMLFSIRIVRSQMSCIVCLYLIAIYSYFQDWREAADKEKEKAKQKF